MAHHARVPHSKLGVCHATMFCGKCHGVAWLTPKMPHVCEVINGLYCTYDLLLHSHIHGHYTEITNLLMYSNSSVESSVYCTVVMKRFSGLILSTKLA